MRYPNGTTWPCCDGCDRQMPSPPDAPGRAATNPELVKLGWGISCDGKQHLCPTCYERRLG